MFCEIEMKLETHRLILRQWKESDTLAKTLATFIRKNNWGVWALENKSTQEFIGFTGIKPTPDYLSFSPSIEILWRLDSQYWHKGYASEAATKSLEFAFNTLKIKSIVSYTSAINTPSQKVMQRIGMFNTKKTFQHPKVDKSSPLSAHVLYKVEKLITL